MLTDGQRESENVEDRRGIGGRGMAVGGGVGTIVIALIVWLMGGDPGKVMHTGPGGGQGVASTLNKEQEEKWRKFATVVLAQTEDVWAEQLYKQKGRRYAVPKLVLFTGAVDSACGEASSAVGPFYCPGDQKLYLDLAFFNDMTTKLNAPGDFAQAYVIAHEVGHHVQNLMGYMEGRGAGADKNAQSVRVELQADFLAGVWAHYAQKRGVLEKGDIEEAMKAAEAVGDDTLQRRAGGRVRPETFTHGSSADRAAAFRKGLETGQIDAWPRP